MAIGGAVDRLPSIDLAAVTRVSLAEIVEIGAVLGADGSRPRRVCCRWRRYELM